MVRGASIKVNEFCCSKNLELFALSSSSSTLPSFSFFLLPARSDYSPASFHLHHWGGSRRSSEGTRARMPRCICVVNLLPLFKEMHHSPLLSSPPAPSLPSPVSYCRPSLPPLPPTTLAFSPSVALILRIKESHFIEEGEPELHLFLLSQ